MFNMEFQHFKLVVCALLAVVVSGTEDCDSKLNPYMLDFGKEVGDIANVDADEVFNIPYDFKAFGKHYKEGWKVKKAQATEGNVAGAFHIYPRMHRKTAGSFEVRASRLDYDVLPESYVAARVSEKSKDMEDVARLINDAYPCVADSKFLPLVAFIASFVCVKSNNHKDTFQAVIATDEVRTFVILIYSQLAEETQSAQFGIKDFEAGRKFRLTLDRADRTSAMLAETNGVRPGVWAYDVTDYEAKRPEGCGKTPYECTVGLNGAVEKFDGFYDSLDMVTRNRTLLSSSLPHDDLCNLVVLAHKNPNYQLRSVQVQIGNGTETEYLRDIYFGKKRELILIKGEDVKGTLIPDLPYTYSAEGHPMIVITETSGGFILSSPVCEFQLEYSPRGVEPMLRVTLGEKYADHINGLCGDFNGLFWDDVLE